MKTYFLLVVEKYDNGAVRMTVYDRKRAKLPSNDSLKRPGVVFEHHWFETLGAAEAAKKELEGRKI